MDRIRKDIRRVFWLFFAMMLLVMLSFLKFVLVDSAEIVNSPYNKRIYYNDENIIRGEIFDSFATTTTGSGLAVNVGDDRHYPYDNLFAHTVGYVDEDMGGIESSYSLEMNEANNYILQLINEIMTGEKPQGNNLRLTLDLELQQVTEKALGNNRGAVITMDPSTGKILSMVSVADFNPNTVSENWVKLSNDYERNPLINRGTQGTYPPGSIFKIAMASLVMENIPNWEEYIFQCDGSVVIDGEKIDCFDKIAHGSVDLHDAITYSCNGYFAVTGHEIDINTINKKMESLLFNSDIKFDISSKNSKFELSDDTPLGIELQTFIGQGKTLETPLHALSIVSAVANSGMMMQPYLVDEVIDYKGDVIQKTMPKKLVKAFSIEEAELLTGMMKNVVDVGTGKGAKLQGYTSAGKTGTAQVTGKEDHGWYVGFAPAEEPQIAIVVLMENSGGSKTTLPVAKKIFEYYLNR